MLKISDKIFLSVIVPVFNEAGVVAELHAKITKMCNELAKPFEIIFVNDGSTDGTLAILRGLRPVKVINFRKNFGQTAALDAGLKIARGRFVATLDGDGQNDPADIPNLLHKLETEDLDVVCGWRADRRDPPAKKAASRLAGWLRRILIHDGITDSGCTLRVYRHECFNHLDLYGEMHRFIPALLKIKGFRVGEAKVSHYPRLAGRTKYNWKRGIKGVIDLLSVWFWQKYRSRPLHLFGGIGLGLIFLSVFFWLMLGYEKIFKNIDLSDTAVTILAVFVLLAGLQFFVFGLLIDLTVKNYYGLGRDRSYMIKEVLEP